MYSFCSSFIYSERIFEFKTLVADIQYKANIAVQIQECHYYLDISIFDYTSDECSRDEHSSDYTSDESSRDEHSSDENSRDDYSSDESSRDEYSSDYIYKSSRDEYSSDYIYESSRGEYSSDYIYESSRDEYSYDFIYTLYVYTSSKHWLLISSTKRTKLLIAVRIQETAGMPLLPRYFHVVITQRSKELFRRIPGQCPNLKPKQTIFTVERNYFPILFMFP
ncbi:hypothetical protein CDAR_3391 [Caerostris darwini]|uniref:Uncharacterized protein n=1 Tax=Caerostris darwini TaxID=1538125 RepID=A0AAV4QXT4_9ARAC|nr:hypothetical protein CDAR_3391 [Caerostris darwini]